MVPDGKYSRQKIGFKCKWLLSLCPVCSLFESVIYDVRTALLLEDKKHLRKASNSLLQMPFSILSALRSTHLLYIAISSGQVEVMVLNTRPIRVVRSTIHLFCTVL
jgi:hypothetical protein